jgi:hypothetical protein
MPDDPLHWGVANHIAKWDGSSWSALGSGMNGGVSALAVDGSGNVYAGGNFTTAGGVSANFIAKWDGSSWSALGSGMNDGVHALAVDGSGSLYAGGYFTTAGDVSANFIAKWDGNSWSALGSGMDDGVNALTVDGGGNVYAAGYFTIAGGVSANFIAKWDGNSWSALGSGMNDGVHALAVDVSGNVYAGGGFAIADGDSVKYIAKWNGSSWSTLGSGMNNQVLALAVDGSGSGSLYAGGYFTTAGDKVSLRFGRYSLNLSVTPEGTNVVVQPTDATTGATPITLTFDNVTQAGNTSLATSSGGPLPPDGFVMGIPTIYYDITTTATFTGTIDVCIDYSNVTFINEATLQLFHFEGGVWVDRTSSHDPVNNIICANVTSFSPFALFEPAKEVVLATNSVWLKDNANILSGNVIVNAASSGPVLDSNVELSVGQSVTTHAGFAFKANRIKVKQGAVVASNVVYNELTNNGAITGSQNSPLTLPVFAGLPPFHQAPAGTQDITVLSNESITLTPGAYRDLLIKQNGTILFTGGGTFSLRSLNTGDKAKLLFDAPTEILIQNKLDTDQNSYIGPQSGSGIGAADIVFYVAGINGNNGNLGATPKAAQLGLKNTVLANFYVPNGTLWLRQGAVATGAFLGRDVIVGENVQVALESAFDGGSSLAKSANNEGGQEKLISTAIPEAFVLLQNYPNPFSSEARSPALSGGNPSTVIKFALPKASKVTLRIYTETGQLVRTLVERAMPAGQHALSWDGRTSGNTVAAGYCTRLSAEKWGSSVCGDEADDFSEIRARYN